MGRMILVVVVFAFVCADGSAQCTGETKDTELNGGDGQVVWKSRYRLVSPGDGQKKAPVYSYERSVHNSTANEIANVYWPGASFEIKRIAAHQEICQWTTVLQPPDDPTDAPLFYGVTDTKHPARVWAPKGGWTKAGVTTTTTIVASGIAFTTDNDNSSIIVSAATQTWNPSAPTATAVTFMNGGSQSLFVSVAEPDSGTHARGMIIGVRPFKTLTATPVSAAGEAKWRVASIYDANLELVGSTTLWY